jgi:hypothetical protein
MGKSIVILASTALFTVLGIIAGTVVVLNLPKDLHDPEGFMRPMSVLCPAAGGLVAGVVVGIIAVVLGGSKGSAKAP